MPRTLLCSTASTLVTPFAWGGHGSVNEARLVRLCLPLEPLEGVGRRRSPEYVGLQERFVAEKKRQISLFEHRAVAKLPYTD